MKRTFFLLALVAPVICGCGPSALELRERTISVLNTEADRWDGAKEFATTAEDAFGRPLTCSVDKRTLDYVLVIRSNGPDGLPKNSDDITVSRSKRHGETSVVKELENASEGVGRGGASGVIQGIKKGLGVGEKKQ